MITIERQVMKKLSGANMQAALRMEPTLAEVFHENTKLTPMSSRSYGAWINYIASSPALKSLLAQPYKVYSLMDQEELPAVAPRTELERLIAERRSGRHYTGEPLTREELARLLFYSYGRTDHRYYFRAVASGGGLFPLELYPVVLNVEGLAPGVYHYDVEHHRLDVVDRRDRREEFEKCIWFDGIEIQKAAVLLIVAAIFQRSTFKYRDRGYRMVLMEAGEAAQNLALQAGNLGLGACLVGGFHDDNLSRLLGIDGTDEAPLVPIVLGRRPAAGGAAAPSSW